MYVKTGWRLIPQVWSCLASYEENYAWRFSKGSYQVLDRGDPVKNQGRRHSPQDEQIEVAMGWLCLP